MKIPRKCEDTEGVINSRKSRKDNQQIVKRKGKHKVNNDLKNITQKTND